MILLGVSNSMTAMLCAQLQNYGMHEWMQGVQEGFWD